MLRACEALQAEESELPNDSGEPRHSQEVVLGVGVRTCDSDRLRVST